MNQNAVPLIQNWGDFVQWLTPHLKQHYSVEEFARQVNRRPFTVREWCRLGRINATKSMTHSGPTTVWVISHEELERLRREGLLPRSVGPSRTNISSRSRARTASAPVNLQDGPAPSQRTQHHPIGQVKVCERDK